MPLPHSGPPLHTPEKVAPLSGPASFVKKSAALSISLLPSKHPVKKKPAGQRWSGQKKS
jgi:hypothetical protein